MMSGFFKMSVVFCFSLLFFFIIIIIFRVLCSQKLLNLSIHQNKSMESFSKHIPATELGAKKLPGFRSSTDSTTNNTDMISLVPIPALTNYFARMEYRVQNS